MLGKQKKYSRAGQNIAEYTILITLVLGAFIATTVYVKRGLQGRWKAAVDDLGDQYDPTTAMTDITYRTNSATNTFITTNETLSTIQTFRNDASSSIEEKTGETRIEAY